VRLAPANGLAGADALVSGAGFPAGRVTVTLAGRRLAAPVVRGGRFAARVTLPARLPGVAALTTRGRGESVVSRYVRSTGAVVDEVTSSAGWRLRWTPYARGSVLVQGAGFARGAAVTLRLGGRRAQAVGPAFGRRLALARGASRAAQTLGVQVPGARFTLPVATGPGRIVVETRTSPADAGPFLYPFRFVGRLGAFALQGSSRLAATVRPGTYPVALTASPGYRLTGVACDPGRSTGSVATRTATLAVAPGQTVGCTFATRRDAASDPAVGAAGDIACDPQSSDFNGGAGTATACRQRDTSDLLLASGLTAVLPLGDEQYEWGGIDLFRQSYDPSWGRLKAITFPVVGNHEYYDVAPGAGSYFDYFGARAGQRGQGWYSYDIGAWHFIALNSNCAQVGGCDESSPQGRWLAADLAAHPGGCTLAYWHHPRFSSGGAGDDPITQGLWNLLYAGGADLILNGHDHDYERFAPQDPQGNADPARGIREFVVGTGGKDLEQFATLRPNSEVRGNGAFGVLRLTLRPGSYDWQLLTIGDSSFGDSGSGTCH
jgi:hypothetical protein